MNKFKSYGFLEKVLEIYSEKGINERDYKTWKVFFDSRNQNSEYMLCREFFENTNPSINDIIANINIFENIKKN